MQWNQSTMYEQRVRFILEVQQGTFSYGARIKGCVKERRRTFPLTINQRVPS